MASVRMPARPIGGFLEADETYVGGRGDPTSPGRSLENPGQELGRRRRREGCRTSQQSRQICAHSGRSRPAFPIDCDQSFRLIATTRSGRLRPGCGRGDGHRWVILESAWPCSFRKERDARTEIAHAKDTRRAAAERQRHVKIARLQRASVSASRLQVVSCAGRGLRHWLAAAGRVDRRGAGGAALPAVTCRAW